MEKIKILERTDNLKAVEAKVKNKWNWTWLQEKDDNGDFLSDYVRKLDRCALFIMLGRTLACLLLQFCKVPVFFSRPSGISE